VNSDTYESGVTLSVAEAAAAVAGRLSGDDVVFHGVGTDTRTLRPGTLFVALRGEHFDGHDFIDLAMERGAVAAVVDRAVDSALSLIEVDDTRIALGRLAAAWRSRFTVPLVAVTGSNGKTTVKEMIASILSCDGDGLVTVGNLNNDIGVPLTLLRLSSDHRFAVIEMGANHAGEIGYLTGLAQPSVAVITNAGPAHLEGFGDLAGVARAKGEIFRGLAGSGIAVINADDAFARLWLDLASTHRTLTFGFDAGAAVHARDVGESDGAVQAFVLVTPHGEVAVNLPLAGRHNCLNALAASAVATAVGATLADIKNGLERMNPVNGRLQMRAGMRGTRIIDDTYNANPSSVSAALRVLAGYGAVTRKWFVLGDMAELGGDAAELHATVGLEARHLGIDRIYAVGKLAVNAADAFGEGARRYAGHDDLIAELRSDIASSGTAGAPVILVKGSRSMHMERVVLALLDDGDTGSRAGSSSSGGMQARHCYSRAIGEGG